MDDTYLYDGTVVVKTGRMAKKEATTSARRTRVAQSDELYEITPLDKEEGSWKKWVRLNELYIIVEDNDDGNA